MGTITDITTAMKLALERDLPPVWLKGRPDEDDVQVYAFPQSWRDSDGTGLFLRTTTVVMCEGAACVYHGGELAYTVPDVSKKVFLRDLRSQDLLTAEHAPEFYGALLPPEPVADIQGVKR